MAAAITDVDIYQVAPNPGVSCLLVTTRNTVDATDTIDVNLPAYGINATGLIGVIGFKHTTDNSVMVQEQPTTAVASGVLTLTVPAGTDNDARFYLIYGLAKPNDLT